MTSTTLDLDSYEPYNSDKLRVEIAEPEEYGDENARNAGKKVVSTPFAKSDAPEVETVGGEPDGSDSDETDDSI